MMERPVVLADGVVRLREVTAEDASDLYRWRMEPATRAMFLDDREVPFAAHLDYLARYFAPANRDHWFVVEAEGRKVGAIALYDRAADDSDAEWGRLVIDPAERRRGWARRALRLLVAHARSLGVRRLRCEVMVGNAAEHLYRELGFAPVSDYDHHGRRVRRMAARLEDGPVAAARSAAQ